jgi:hypothetical protein
MAIFLIVMYLREMYISRNSYAQQGASEQHAGALNGCVLQGVYYSGWREKNLCPKG